MSEHTDQVALFEWAERMSERLPALRLMFHIPNGERRDKVTGARLKKAGVKRGVPDICLPIARRYVGDDWHGLYIEMKTKCGRQSKEQREWEQLLFEQGYLVVVVRSWWEAARLIVYYLGERLEDYGLALDAAAAMEGK